MGFGIFYMISAALMQALVATIIKTTAPTLPISIQLACYYSIPLLLFLYLVLKNGWELYRSAKFLIHFIRAIFAVSSVFCFFYSIKYIPLGLSTTLFNMIPFFVPIISYTLLKEKIHFTTYLSLSIAISGALLIINPRYLSFSVFYFIAGLSAAILMATAMVLLKYLAQNKESTNQILFNQYASCALLSLLSVGAETLLHPHSIGLEIITMNTTTLILLISLGLLSLGIQYCFSKAAQLMTASQFAPFLYVSVPISSMIGFVMWKQSLSLTMIIGSLLIFLGLCLPTLRQRWSVTSDAKRHVYRT